MFVNPIVQAQKMWDFWAQVSRDQVSRFDRIATHTKEAEDLAVSRAKDAVDESARLVRESIDYATALVHEWRSVTMTLAKTAEAEKA